MAIVFDIETGPLPDEILDQLIPPFDPDAVKLGNLKDPAKIAEKIAEAERNHVTDFKAKAALSPISGQVLAIGYLESKDDAEPTMEAYEHEEVMLEDFWLQFSACAKRPVKMIGHNILGFDLPFLVRRSFVHGVTVPAAVMDQSRRYWHKCFIDTMKYWACGEYQTFIGLDRLSAVLGCVGRKNGNGADFAELLKSDRGAALAYLENDLRVQLECAQRLRLC